MKTDIERADAFSRQQVWYMLALAAVLVTHQALFFSWDWEAVTLEQTMTWTILALGVLLALMTHGKWFTPRRVRELVNDEVTRANRTKAIERGFIAAMLAAILVFAISPFEPVSAQRAAHLIVTVGLATALVVFGWNERNGLG
jgi:hypothetical protein